MPTLIPASLVPGERRCGPRVPGGLYLVSLYLSEPCPILPYPVGSCSACGHGIHPARGWTWIEPRDVWGPEPHGRSPEHALRCPLGGGMPEGRHGLIWVGARHYPETADFFAEAERIGVSRRVKAVPRGFELGTTWVYLGHKNAVRAGVETETRVPGLITAFKPEAVEYIIRGTETDEELAALRRRGLTPVLS